MIHQIDALYWVHMELRNLMDEDKTLVFQSIVLIENDDPFFEYEVTAVCGLDVQTKYRMNIDIAGNGNVSELK